MLHVVRPQRGYEWLTFHFGDGVRAQDVMVDSGLWTMVLLGRDAGQDQEGYH